jgi:signal transduction histidine kinase
MGVVNRTRNDGKGGNRALRAAWLAIGLTWLVLGLLVALGAAELRAQIRHQIESRDGQILSEMARMQGGEGGSPSDDDWEQELDEDPMMVFMKITGWEGTVAAWMLDPSGTVASVLPLSVEVPSMPREAQASVKEGRPFSRFIPSMRLSDVFLSTNLLDAATGPGVIPVLEVYVPLRGEAEEGALWVAGFLIEAQSLADQFRRLDRQLLGQALAALGVAMGITGVTLGWVFRRLARAHRLLERRTEDLLRANQDLSRSARIAALGAVTAHLVHGLKNPVSGLQTFVAARSADGGGQEDEWREAQAATQRMQTLIHDVVRVIREQETDLAYEVPLREVGESVVARARPSAERRGVRLTQEGSGDRELDNRTSGLLALILGNLVENAIEATPEGGCVKLHLFDEAGAIVCEVVDEGSGIGAEAQRRLFQPQPSTKEGGSGLGLAITRQLALALGGDVRLLSSDRHGSTFRVELPHDPTCAEPISGQDSAAGASREVLGRPGA